MAHRSFIDTQVALWLARGDSRITAATLKWLNSGSETLMSAISIAELEMKAAIGKLALPPNFSKVFSDQGIKIEPFDELAASAIPRFPSLARHDPFDRMILAQASTSPNTWFFTADEALVSLGLDWVVDCRS